jgi:hypothetical protein
MPHYPSLYQINTRVWLTAKAAALGRPASLEDISDADLDDIVRLGFDWVWLLSVWQTGAAGRRVSRANAEWRAGFQAALPGLQEEDIGGSGFACCGYRVADNLGGDAALEKLRRRMHARGLKLMVDFVPNHVALDHPWLEGQPDFFITGNAERLGREPHNFIRLQTGSGERILAHGRDPYFPGWPDTLQLNYANPALREAMRGELAKLTRLADGVRCDMAMLLLPEVFERTWGLRCEPFWPEAIASAKRENADFLFLAEVYWDLEWVLQQQGFDYTYDKRLYDRLHQGAAAMVREHLRAGLDFQNRLARFLENHDEPRAASQFPPGKHEAAAVATYFTPGLRFFQQGQLDGWRTHVSPHLIRGPREETDPRLHEFYRRLLGVLKRAVYRKGEWCLLENRPAWDGNPTHECILAYDWQTPAARSLVCVNYAPHPAQAYVALPGMGRGSALLRDLLGPAVYARAGEDLARGLYLDMPGWGVHVFEIEG